jgi:cytochrome c-type biogenesis protein CcmE
MNQIQKKKFNFLIWGLLVIAAVIALVTYALRQNISLYYTPSQIMQNQAPKDRLIRAGGMVVKKSIVRSPKGLDILFKLTDYQDTIQVQYHGILPDLFREGQGVVVKGYIRKGFGFEATEVLAKHDENYMPPEVQKSLKEKKS